ncbi:AAA family ATPase [Bradyrhizobium sp. DASA03120]|uniref:AAA family ATPase n=1 Tax=Bradyrhizobium sp. SMVTL-02 TaxID=3395917 RepID=UPI003F7103EB
MSEVKKTANRDDARRVMNKQNAMRLARSGVPVFPSSGKVPLVKCYNKLDTEISAGERAAAVEKAREDGNTSLTVFVGATTNEAVVKRMWRDKNRDAVPSVACGPAKLVVIDADTKFNGPEKIAALFAERGGVPEGVQVITTQSGGRHYIFSDPDNAFTNSAGKLKTEYGCDVRGRGGQFVAPGSVRENGKTYGDTKTLNAFIAAYTAGTIPPLPDYIVELIGASSSAVNDIPATKERDVIQRIEQADIPGWEELCAPLGDYDFEGLKSANAEFAQLYDEPSDDCSANRFKAARHVLREWPTMPVEHLASFFQSWDGAGEFVGGKPRSGEYNARQIAREWFRNASSTGAAFGASVDDEDEVAERDAYITNGGTEAKWDAWKERLETEKAERVARAERNKVKAMAEQSNKLQNDIDDLDRAIEALADDVTLEVEGAADAVKALEEQRYKKARQLEKQDKEAAKLDAGFLWQAEVAQAFTVTDDLIEDVLPASGVVALQGDSNTGKTFLALHMADCVQRGVKFLGRNVIQGGAMLVAGEGRQGMSKRLTALYRERPSEGRGIAVRTDLPNFGAGVQAAAQKLRAMIARYNDQQGHVLRLLVLDNLTRLIGGADMNVTHGVSEMFSALEDIAQEFSLCVVVLHHWNKSGKGAGTFAIRAAVDSVLDLSEEKAGVKRISGDKVRDGAKGEHLKFKLREVVLGKNRWGNDVGSCVVEEYTAMCAVSDEGSTDEEEAPTVKMPDRREDRMEDVLAIFDDEAKRQKADDESLRSARERLELQMREIVTAVNTRRKSAGLEQLGRASVQACVREAVEADLLTICGTKALPFYKLAA